MPQADICCFPVFGCPFYPSDSWLVSVLGQGYAAFLYLVFKTPSRTHAGDYLSRSGLDSAPAALSPLGASWMVAVINDQKVAETKGYSLGTVTLKKNTDLNEREVCGYAFSFTLWRRPNSFRFSVVCHVPSWTAPDFFSFFLSLSYQKLTVILSLDLHTFSTYSCNVALERRSRPLKAGSFPYWSSRWLPWTLACIQLRQGRHQVYLNHLLWS